GLHEVAGTAGVVARDRGPGGEVDAVRLLSLVAGPHLFAEASRDGGARSRPETIEPSALGGGELGEPCAGDVSMLREDPGSARGRRQQDERCDCVQMPASARANSRSGHDPSANLSPTYCPSSLDS